MFSVPLAELLQLLRRAIERYNSSGYSSGGSKHGNQHMHTQIEYRMSINIEFFAAYAHKGLIINFINLLNYY